MLQRTKADTRFCGDGAAGESRGAVAQEHVLGGTQDVLGTRILPVGNSSAGLELEGHG